MKFRTKSLNLLSLLVLTLTSNYIFNIGCGPAPGAPEPAAGYTLTAAATGTAPAGGTLSSIQVKVADKDGKTLNCKFDFVVKSGLGSLNKTTETGTSSSFDWKLGRKFGEQTIEITASEVGGTTKIEGSPFTLKVNTLTVKDVDDNTYNTTQIGSQVWIAENLKTSKFRDGTSLLTGLDSAGWTNATEGAFVYMEDNSANNSTYGKLYNGSAIKSAKGICPAGWHVATEAEWTSLIHYTGGESDAGNALISKDNWANANETSTDSLLLSIQPGGLLGTPYEYVGFKSKSQAYFWSAADATNTYGFGQGPFFTDGGSMFFFTTC